MDIDLERQFHKLHGVLNSIADELHYLNKNILIAGIISNDYSLSVKEQDNMITMIKQLQTQLAGIPNGGIRPQFRKKETQ